MEKKVVKKEIKESINFEIPAYVFGVISIIEAIFSPLLGIILSIIGLVLSYRQTSRLSRRARILSWVGLVLGIIVFAIILIITLKSGATADLGTSII